jgi:hypothetical protein
MYNFSFYQACMGQTQLISIYKEEEEMMMMVVMKDDDDDDGRMVRMHAI